MTSTVISEIRTFKYAAGPCLGRCPVFWMAVHADGLVEYEAICHMDLQGSYEGRLIDGQLVALSRRIEKANVEQMLPRYARNVTCAATERIEITFADGRTHAVENYADAAPDGFRMLRAYVGKLVRTIQWRRIDDRFPSSEGQSSVAARAQPCRCGSGRRFENCCGLVE